MQWKTDYFRLVDEVVRVTRHKCPNDINGAMERKNAGDE